MAGYVSEMPSSYGASYQMPGLYPKADYSDPDGIEIRDTLFNAIRSQIVALGQIFKVFI